MRNLVLLLVLANVLYFLYAEFVEQPTVDTGVIVRDEAELVPLAAVPEPEQPPPEPTCYSIEYFEDVDAAEAAMAALEGLDSEWVVAEATRPVFVGYWVQVTGLATRNEADTYQTRLEDGGVEESYRVGDDNEGYVLSLGLFSARDGAETVLEQARALNVPATIIERTRPEAAARVMLDLVDASVLDSLVGDDDALAVTDCGTDVAVDTDADAQSTTDSPASEADADPE